MKKMLCLLLILCCIVPYQYSFAEAKMSAKDKILITFEGDWKAYFFARVENTGDTAAYLDFDGSLIGFDADDNVIINESYVSSYPNRPLLAPGESVYVREYILEDSLRTATVTDYKYTPKADKYGYEYEYIPCEGSVQFVGGDSYDNYTFVTFTNTTDSILYNFSTIVALFDQEGKLMYVNSSHHSSVGVHPGCTITVRETIDSDLAAYYTREGLIPTTIDSKVAIQH